MRAQRPVYLNLLKIRQPLPALVSIFHRISGALLFLMLPWVLHVFHGSLSSQEAFDALQNSAFLRAGLFLMLAMYAYHFFAGLRFLVFDLHSPGLYQYLRASSLAVLALALLVMAGLGAWLW